MQGYILFPSFFSSILFSHYSHVSDQGEPNSNPRRYRGLVDKLNYRTTSHPKITFAMKVINQILNSPSPDHWDEGILGMLLTKASFMKIRKILKLLDILMLTRQGYQAIDAQLQDIIFLLEVIYYRGKETKCCNKSYASFYRILNPPQYWTLLPLLTFFSKIISTNLDSQTGKIHVKLLRPIYN